jgi:two-component system, NtrC family, sensor histidine kinase HydH
MERQHRSGTDGRAFRQFGDEVVIEFVLGFACALVLAMGGGIVAYCKWLRPDRRMLGQTRQQVENLGRLTGGLAHEIKNPLSTIKVNLQLLSEDLQASDPQVARWRKKLQVVQKETDRLQTILDEFLRYIGKPELNPVPADLNPILNDMADFFAPQARAAGILIRQVLSPEPMIAAVDVNAFKQTLLNLFLNAQQAMPDGGELILRTGREKCVVFVEITDTGCGIESQNLDKIFLAYYTTRASGSGLGLPTARKIVAAQGGTITVASQAGKGSCFRIELPALPG